MTDRPSRPKPWTYVGDLTIFFITLNLCTRLVWLLNHIACSSIELSCASTCALLNKEVLSSPGCNLICAQQQAKLGYLFYNENWNFSVSEKAQCCSSNEIAVKLNCIVLPRLFGFLVQCWAATAAWVGKEPGTSQPTDLVYFWILFLDTNMWSIQYNKDKMLQWVKYKDKQLIPFTTCRKSNNTSIYILHPHIRHLVAWECQIWIRMKGSNLKVAFIGRSDTAPGHETSCISFLSDIYPSFFERSIIAAYSLISIDDRGMFVAAVSTAAHPTASIQIELNRAPRLKARILFKGGVISWTTRTKMSSDSMRVFNRLTEMDIFLFYNLLVTSNIWFETYWNSYTLITWRWVGLLAAILNKLRTIAMLFLLTSCRRSFLLKRSLVINNHFSSLQWYMKTKDTWAHSCIVFCMSSLHKPTLPLTSSCMKHWLSAPQNYNHHCQLWPM